LHLLRDTETNAPKNRESTELRRFLYASAGLAMLLVACEQGERLDWWRSGVFNALFAGGAFFLMCALVRRLRGPNPLVALPYLLKWNTLLLGTLLFWFRFTLCTTIILVPRRWPSAGSNRNRLGLRSSGVLCHLFLWRSRLHFCCYAIRSVFLCHRPCLYCLCCLVEFSIQQHVDSL